MPRRRKTIAIVGLGYVGLPLAVLAAEKGYKIIGLDIDEKRVEMINDGKSPIDDPQTKRGVKKGLVPSTSDPRELKKAQIIIVTVPTPVDKTNLPDLRPLKQAMQSIAKNLKKGRVIIIESTINPGVCEEVLLPILERSGAKVGKDIFLAHCPERVDPGNKRWKVGNIPRVIGAFSPRGLKKAKAFYDTILDAEVKPMKSLKETEAVKIVENAFRDVNIAFVNELAKSFDIFGIDLVDVIEGASTKPFAFMPHWPSRGVGGHCIPVDPYYLIERARQNDFSHDFLSLARKINNSMPVYTVERLRDALNEIGKPMKGTKVAVLGISYKPDISDLRETPALKIIEQLNAHGCKVIRYDPLVEEMSDVESLSDALKESEAVVLVTAHKEVREVKPGDLKRNRISVVIDGMNAWDRGKIIKAGIVYRGIGK